MAKVGNHQKTALENFLGSCCNCSLLQRRSGKINRQSQVLHVLHSDVYAQKACEMEGEARGAWLYLPLQLSLPRGEAGMAAHRFCGKLKVLATMEQFWQTLQAPGRQMPSAKSQRKESTKSSSSRFQTAASQLVSLPGLRAVHVLVQSISPWHRNAGGEG